MGKDAFHSGKIILNKKTVEYWRFQPRFYKKSVAFVNFYIRVNLHFSNIKVRGQFNICMQHTNKCFLTEFLGQIQVPFKTDVC
jgi:hypothetical protein